jgi:hypothetical protein
LPHVTSAVISQSGSEYEETSDDEDYEDDQYRVMANSKIRAGFAMTSADKGALQLLMHAAPGVYP